MIVDQVKIFDEVSAESDRLPSPFLHLFGHTVDLAFQFLPFCRLLFLAEVDVEITIFAVIRVKSVFYGCSANLVSPDAVCSFLLKSSFFPEHKFIYELPHAFYHEYKLVSVLIHELDIFLAEIAAVENEAYMLVTIPFGFSKHVSQLRDVNDAPRITLIKQWFPVVPVIRNGVIEHRQPLVFLWMSYLNQFDISGFAILVGCVIGDVDFLPVISFLIPFIEKLYYSLSEFSRKARTKGTRDISVLYAFDLEEMEPVCSKCFPGNMLDATSYSEFIRENHITKGIIVADKGFPESAAHDQFESNSDLHYLNPVKRNSKLIERHNMLDFTGILPGYEGITYRKEKCTGTNKWLYSFRDSRKAAKEEADWLRRAKKAGTYKLEDLREKQQTFGTIVLECDLDLPSETVYKAYDSRWEIEIVMRYYKSACEFDETRVQDDYSVIGSEFCDFLSTVLTFRLMKQFDRAKLLEDRTYKKLMSVLERAKKVRVDDKDWQLIRINPSQEEILQELSLLPKPEYSVFSGHRNRRS